MDFTAEQLEMISYLRSSVRLQSPETEVDPAYKFTDDELYSILKIVTPAHNSTYDIDSLPKSDFYYVVLLAKKEIFYRLASSTAPFYPLSAEGAKLEKNVRFDHYMSLIKSLKEEYESMTDTGGGNEDSTGTGGTVQTYQTKLWGKAYLSRFAELSDAPSIEVKVSGITETSVNLDWTRHESTHGTHFGQYLIYFGTAPIFDEYAVVQIDPKRKPNFIVHDVRRTKLRISDLLPNTQYYVLVKTENTFGLNGFHQVSFTTLEQSVVTP